MWKIRNKFRRPKVPFDSTRIKEEKDIINEYGLRRKKEILIAEEILRNFRRRARELIAVENKVEEETLLDKLFRLGLAKKGADLDDVLALKIKDILDRRLQTRILKLGLAKTAKQARQLIVHGHIAIGDRRTSFPAYLIPLDEEAKIGWFQTSKLKGGKK